MTEKAAQEPSIGVHEQAVNSLVRIAVLVQGGANTIPLWMQCDPGIHVDEEQRRVYELAAQRLGSLTKKEVKTIYRTESVPPQSTEGSVA